ncbi:MAG: VWA domain-containing protein [Anaerolineales bacterium]|nr:VWA domain-containing protein [Anaerolineales bacterium]
MPVKKDYYAILGVPRNATQAQIRRAYRESALRLHPDKNLAPGETELFLDVSRAYETLSDPATRKAYDLELIAAEHELAERAAFRCTVTNSRLNILRMDEPQVHYLLLDIMASDNLPATRPPVNMAIVVDQSTSMRGQRLDRTRAAALSILKDLDEEDTVSLISFSDRAEVILTPEQAKDIRTARARLSLLQAGGGTEIAQGMEEGLQTLHTNFRKEAVNHMVLLTDGRTYGDEDICISLADQAASDGITINCVGIGSEWSDRLLDDIASRTGGYVIFLNSPRAIKDLLEGIFNSLSQVIASSMKIEGAVGQQVDLRSAFRIQPDPMPLGDSLPMSLGHLLRDSLIRIIIEMVIHPLGDMEELTLAHLNIRGDILSEEDEVATLPLVIQSPVSREPDLNPPPEVIIDALNLIALYRMQEKARHESELGQSAQAAKRLENLAMHLVASGERDLAKAALSEAVRLSRTQRLSSEGEKILKYGTRALLLPSSEKSEQ